MWTFKGSMADLRYLVIERLVSKNRKGLTWTIGGGVRVEAGP